jgi:integrase
MSRRVCELLKERAKGGTEGRVFTTVNGTPIGKNLRRKLRACLDAAGISRRGVTVHSLRYSFCSWLIQRGASLPAVKDLLGHRDVRMTLRVYTQTMPGDRQKAIALLDRGPAPDESEQQTESRRHASVTQRKGFQLVVA